MCCGQPPERPPLESHHELRATESSGEGVEAKLAVGQIAKSPIYYHGFSPRLEEPHTRATYFKLSGVRELGKIFLRNTVNKA